jgi:hypothetical protein
MLDRPPQGSILLRVFFCTAERKVILLMSGYDKAEDPNERRQRREIANARKLVTAYQKPRSAAGRGADARAHI